MQNKFHFMYVFLTIINIIIIKYVGCYMFKQKKRKKTQGNSKIQKKTYIEHSHNDRINYHTTKSY